MIPPYFSSCPRLALQGPSLPFFQSGVVPDYATGRHKRIALKKIGSHDSKDGPLLILVRTTFPIIHLVVHYYIVTVSISLLEAQSDSPCSCPPFSIFVFVNFSSLLKLCSRVSSPHCPLLPSPHKVERYNKDKEHGPITRHFAWFLGRFRAETRMSIQVMPYRHPEHSNILVEHKRTLQIKFVNGMLVSLPSEA